MLKHFHKPRPRRHRLTKGCIELIKQLSSMGMHNNAILLNVRKAVQPLSPDAFVNSKDIQNIAATVREGRLSDRDVDSVSQQILLNNSVAFDRRSIIVRVVDSLSFFTTLPTSFHQR